MNFKKGLEKTFLWYLQNENYYKSISKDNKSGVWGTSYFDKISLIFSAVTNSFFKYLSKFVGGLKWFTSNSLFPVG